MARKKEIDRDKVLDAAEAVILKSGGRYFTLDAVAEHAGVSKGGLVYTFATKDKLIYAALEREVARFQEAVHRRLRSKPAGPFELVLAHIEEALEEEDNSTQTAAFLITAFVHAPSMLEPVRQLYSSLLDPLRTVEHNDAAEVRHALMAVEGIFLLQGLGFAEISPDEIKAVLLYARKIVLSVLEQPTKHLMPVKNERS
ncbi:TetR/AcrR family transcriptional regulator [Dickeya zeae]|uniref:TetR/AcrR family transcriptional regulator n=1 Tax=Dickeya zeae TaxID=204042 RepID=A0AAE6YZA7_9GAMM|nr:TetR/AcrR family transcriptional regulator [Dickeya zeae]QIZ50987.1 TetR/AcrR family transcriptional regulator [Dickeya zeae]